MDALTNVLSINYCHASNDMSWLGQYLWRKITPGLSAVFLIGSGIWFLVLMLTNSGPKRTAQMEAMIAFFVTGGLNLLAYLYILCAQKYSGIQGHSHFETFKGGRKLRR